ncbi:EIICBA-Glc 2 [uncultured Clostridium sp.]|uniref:PTS transporter subunit EIIC n=1 Tax=uncultured Clostridium sp. TaxID=59620 RepID=UPI000822B945|nr:PTS transporter subunit EIIC [uncultured Clostridium sp.]SCK02188.1 EIICBA-Glc 2 [uncultured Clostridium sp.]
MRVNINKLLNFFQRLGKAIMIPISALPVAALMLRLGMADVWGPNLFGGNGIPWMVAAGEAVMDQMTLLFAIGISVGLADDNNGTAGLAGAIGYFVFTNVSHSFAGQLYQSISSGGRFETGLLAGIFSGIAAGLIYNKYKDIKLPQFLGFFGGKRFVPIATSLVMVLIGLLFGWVWPNIQENINAFGNMIATSGIVGAFIFGFLNRLLIPFGLHHVINSIFWFQFGEFTTVGGEVVTGDILRFLNGDPTAGIFQTGFFPIMMFALPAACFAMILAAKKEKRKTISGMLLGIAFTSFLTGITEPIEFTFLFLAPGLFVVHAILTGATLAITAFLGMRHGYSFSAGLIDYLLNFNLAENPIGLLGVGLVIGFVYFIIFYICIMKFNLHTPGREEEEVYKEKECKEKEKTTINGAVDNEIKVKPLRSKMDKTAEGIIEAVGGKANINDVDSCITRIRLKLRDSSKLDKGKLKQIGATEIIKLGSNNVQIIIGTMADPIVSRMRRMIRE